MEVEEDESRQAHGFGVMMEVFSLYVKSLMCCFKICLLGKMKRIMVHQSFMIDVIERRSQSL